MSLVGCVAFYQGLLQSSCFHGTTCKDTKPPLGQEERSDEAERDSEEEGICVPLPQLFHLGA